MTERFTPTKFAKCNRCDDRSVTWCRSFKTGKPYLVQVAPDGTAARNEFHRCLSPSLGRQVTYPVSAETDAECELVERELAEMDVVHIQELDAHEIEQFEITKARVTLMERLKNNTLTASARPVAPQKSYTRPATAPVSANAPTEPRSIPCTKCSIPNRLTYADLVTGRACTQCIAQSDR